ncbi:MAG: methionyl-tRNA formyltransferase [Prevotellaceae bacterium]|nr:methionyl-tRNA formyltransferase [Prevotellaceae bacterium]
MSKSAHIVFMGTPDFALGVLQLLIEKHYHVVGVVSTPDKPAGRGLEKQSSAVSLYARSQNISLAQPTSLKDPAFLAQLREWNADLYIVVAFRMIPKEVWSLPRLGTFNLHASLLPQYRGAAPINWALINGETVTGVTTFLIDHQIDTGHILFQESISVLPDDNAGTLHDRLMTLGANIVCRTIDALTSGNAHPVPQPSVTPLHPAPKLGKELCCINWDQEPRQICRLIRGLSPYPAAFCLLQTSTQELVPIKVYHAIPIEASHTHPFGTILCDNKSYLHVACRNGFISLLYLQVAGKKRMTIKEFLPGFRNHQALFVSP